MSKELEALEIVRKELIKCHRLPNETRYDELDIIETALKDYELMKEIRITARFDLAQVNKEHKALEIIKEHRLDIDWFLQFVKQDISYKQYICCVEDSDNEFAKRFLLNEEEYNLLKEVLL